MRKLLIIPAALLLLCLLTACGGQGNAGIATRPDAPVTERTTTGASSTAEKTTREPRGASTQTQAGEKGLLDLALLDRLFSMTLADYFREEGAKKQPEDEFEAGPYYSFSKYDPTSFFFFEGYSESNSPSSMALEATDLLFDRQALTLGELKQWLAANNARYDISDFEGFSCYFTVGKYTIFAYTENDSESDKAVVNRFFVKPKD